MSTQVWTLIIDRESDEGHGVEVFASYRDALTVLPERLPQEWAQYYRHQVQHGLTFDEASFLDALGTLDFLDSAPEVVIEGHELHPAGTRELLSPGGVRPYTSELVEQMTLEELRHVTGAALHIASAYGASECPQGYTALTVIAQRLAPALPEWLPPIDDAEATEGMDWWAQLRDAPSKTANWPVHVWEPGGAEQQDPDEQAGENDELFCCAGCGESSDELLTLHAVSRDAADRLGWPEFGTLPLCGACSHRAA